MALAAIPMLKSTNVFAAGVSCPQAAPTDKKASKKLLDAASSTGKRLDYVANAADSKNKKFTKGSHCGNCSFYQDKKMVENYAPCSMAANRYVANCGWCKTYKKDPKKA